MPSVNFSALLPLADAAEVYVLLDALVWFAMENEKTDSMAAEIADNIAERIREIRALTTEDAVQMVRHLGIGPYERRPQG